MTFELKPNINIIDSLLISPTNHTVASPAVKTPHYTLMQMSCSGCDAWTWMWRLQPIHKPPPLMLIYSNTNMCAIRLMNGPGDEALPWAAVKEPVGHGFFRVSNDVCECACAVCTVFVRRSFDGFPPVTRELDGILRNMKKPQSREHKHRERPAERIPGEPSGMWASRRTRERVNDTGAAEEVSGLRGGADASDQHGIISGAWTCELRPLFPQGLWRVLLSISVCMYE